MAKPFSGANLKVERANQHINELHKIIHAFIKTNFYRFGIEKDPDSGNNVLEISIVKRLPDSIPLIIGDAIHNLRSALDLAVCDIVSGCGSIPDKYLRFTFDSSREQLEARLRGGQIIVAGKDIIDFIVDVIKPYDGGNDPLCALNDIDIIDKHRLLIPTISVVAITGITGYIGNARFEGSTFAAEGESKLRFGLGRDNVKYNLNGKPAFAILFGEGHRLKGQPVVPTLKDLSQVVSGIIKAFEQRFSAKAQIG